jgi:hypothetical protein
MGKLLVRARQISIVDRHNEVAALFHAAHNCRTSSVRLGYRPAGDSQVTPHGTFLRYTRDFLPGTDLNGHTRSQEFFTLLSCQRPNNR